jgi:hypothetical protein
VNVTAETMLVMEEEKKKKNNNNNKHWSCVACNPCEMLKEKRRNQKGRKGMSHSPVRRFLPDGKTKDARLCSHVLLVDKLSVTRPSVYLKNVVIVAEKVEKRKMVQRRKSKKFASKKQKSSML